MGVGSGGVGGPRGEGEGLGRSGGRHVPLWLLEGSTGLVGGVASTLASHPLDTVKVVMQTASGPAAALGALGAARSVVRQGGARGLYVGVGPPLLGNSVDAFVLLGVWGLVMNDGFGDEGLRGAELVGSAPLSHALVAGAASGVAVSLVLAPSELVKCRMQGQLSLAPSVREASSLACLRGILRNAGPAGLFRGLAATMAREVPGCTIYMLAYNHTHIAMQRLLADWSPAARTSASALVAGAAAGGSMYSAVLPFDVAKSRIQADPRADPSVWRNLLALHAEGGIPSLWRGFGPSVGRAVLSNAVSFLAIEWARKALGI